VQACQSVQLRFDRGQLIAQRKRKESLGRAVRPVVRTHLAPPAQQPVLVARLGAEAAQMLAKLCDTQWRVGGENQNGFENNCGEVVRILTQPRVRRCCLPYSAI
jgi:hypothetical protein